MKQKNLKKNTGITFISLIITIVVLLILSVLSIQGISRDGIITKAKNASSQHLHSTIKESLMLAHTEYTLQLYSVGLQNSEKTTFLEFLSSNGYIKENTEGTIDIEKLLGKKTNLGNGTENSDVYKLENGELNYYDKEGNIDELGQISPTEDNETTPPSTTVSDLYVLVSRNTSTTVNVDISNITEADYPISITYSFFINDTVNEIYTEEINSGTDTYATTYNYSEALREYGYFGYARFVVKDGHGNEATIMYNDNNTHIEYNDNIDVYFEGCFKAGTKVVTETGLKNIEDIKVGEKVYSVNMETNEKELASVTEVHNIGYTDEAYNIYIGDVVIVSSPEHPFYIENQGWIAASELKKGDKVISKNGENMQITKTEYVTYGKPLKTYNLTVENHHNFLITQYELLVHNVVSK